MSGLIAIAKPYRIKASHRRRWKCTTGSRPYANNNPYRFTDPDGRAVKVAGSEADQEKFMSQATELTGMQLSNNNGTVSYKGDDGAGMAAVVFKQAIDSDATVSINAVNGEPGVFLDNFSTNEFDVADMAGFMGESQQLGEAMFSHVISERAYAATNGATEVESHRFGTMIESSMMGATSRTQGGSGLVSVGGNLGMRAGGEINWQYSGPGGNVTRQFQFVLDQKLTPR